MSALRDQIKSRSAALVKREPLTLPECGIEVQIRGLMSGEIQRAGQAKRSSHVQAALSVEDPETGKSVWNPNDLEDLDEIAALHPVDLAVILEASNRLSGMDRLGKLFSRQNGSGSSASPESSDAPSGS